MKHPMLAGKYDPEKLRYPVLASPKLDGIRAMATGTALVSRKLIDIPNKHTFDRFKNLTGWDGELILGDPCAKDVYRRTNSSVMSHDKQDNVSFWVFDIWTSPEKYEKRYETLKREAGALMNDSVFVLPQKLIHNEDMLLEYEAEHVELGYEGIMIRDPRSFYKHGRATTNGGELLKVKRYEDSEAYVIDIVEEQFNGNVAVADNLGRTKRSSAAAGKVGKGAAGALHVVDVKTGVDFFVGAGLDAADKAWWWKHRAEILARSARTLIKYKFFPVGVKDKPRHPVFLGLRSEIDL